MRIFFEWIKSVLILFALLAAVAFADPPAERCAITQGLSSDNLKTVLALTDAVMAGVNPLAAKAGKAIAENLVDGAKVTLDELDQSGTCAKFEEKLKALVGIGKESDPEVIKQYIIPSAEKPTATREMGAKVKEAELKLAQALAQPELTLPPELIQKANSCKLNFLKGALGAAVSTVKGMWSLGMMISPKGTIDQSKDSLKMMEAGAAAFKSTPGGLAAKSKAAYAASDRVYDQTDPGKMRQAIKSIGKGTGEELALTRCMTPLGLIAFQCKGAGMVAFEVASLFLGPELLAAKTGGKVAKVGAIAKGAKVAVEEISVGGAVRVGGFEGKEFTVIAKEGPLYKLAPSDGSPAIVVDSRNRLVTGVSKPLVAPNPVADLAEGIDGGGIVLSEDTASHIVRVPRPDGRLYPARPTITQPHAYTGGVEAEVVRFTPGAPKPVLKEGHYTFVINGNGEMALGKVNDIYEFGVKHRHLLGSERGVFAGECRVTVDGSITYNVRSGTISKPILDANPAITPEKYASDTGKAITRITGKPVHFGGPKTLLPSNTPPWAQFVKYCGNAQFRALNLALCGDILNFLRENFPQTALK